MKDNYLWDRSGEPDPEVQELEELLGVLKYQPRPLRIPAGFSLAPRRRFLPALAIAASLILFAAAALWFYLRQPQAAPQPQQVKQEMPQSMPRETTPTPQKPNDIATFNRPQPVDLYQPRRAPRTAVAVNRTRNLTSEPQLTPEELAEKEQVLVALKLVSAKLNLAQRKTQSLPPTNIIRNQHKVG